MPIKGLSEQRRLPRLGKIHLGVKKQSAKTGAEYPTATDYFVVPDDLAQYVGDKPTELSVMIPIEDDELWANQYYKCYSRTRGLVCRGDGTTCRRMIDTATGAKANRDTKDVVWKECECKGRECPDYQAKECKETMNLQFIMPDVPGLGVWQVDTSSINSIRNINSDAAMIRAVYKRIAFIPLLLTLEPQEVVNPDDGKKKTVRCLHLRTNGTMRELMIQAAKPVTELLPPPSPEEDEAPMDIENGKEETEPKRAEPIRDMFADGGTEPSPKLNKEDGIFEAGDCTLDTPKTAAPANVIRKIDDGQINALIVITGATDEADLKVRFERFLERPLKTLRDVTYAEAGRWINELQPAKKVKS